MAILTRDEILGSGLKRVAVPLPELGGEIVLQEMSTALRLEFESKLKNDEDAIRCMVIVYSAVNEQGELIFSEADVVELAKISYKAVKRVSDAAFALNSTRRAELEDAQENF
jgi:hypothetical protein